MLETTLPEEQRKLREMNERLDEIKRATSEDPEYEAKLIDLVLHQSAGIYLSGSNQSSPLRCLSHRAFQKYFDELYEQIEGSEAKDPLHRMMIEQLTVAHHVIGRLMINSANCKDAEILRTQIMLASQLMGEFRRMTQAANSYIPRRRSNEKQAVSFDARAPQTPKRKSKRSVA